MFRFTLPRDIYVGYGAIEKLAVLKGHKKAFICTGGHSMRRGGFLQKVEKVLQDSGLKTRTMEGIAPDPSIEAVKEGAKAMEEFQPDVIIAIGGGSPKTLTAHTGMDALTHATEAYVSTFANGFTDPLAKQAVSDIFDNILESYHGDKEARGKMHIAQCLAGMAFSNGLLGITHSLAHKIGAVFHIPHGCANAILLPYVIQYNKKACMSRYAELARNAGLPGHTDAQLVLSYEDAIRRLDSMMDIPLSLADYGVPEELYLEKKESIAHNAVLDACTPENPRKVDDETMGRILECAYYGKPVTF